MINICFCFFLTYTCPVEWTKLLYRPKYIYIDKCIEQKKTFGKKADAISWDVYIWLFNDDYHFLCNHSHIASYMHLRIYMNTREKNEMKFILTKTNFLFPGLCRFFLPHFIPYLFFHCIGYVRDKHWRFFSMIDPRNCI